MIAEWLYWAYYWTGGIYDEEEKEDQESNS